MRVFIACPYGFATGGTELLHQFSQCLKARGIDCYMVYVGVDCWGCPTPQSFLKYDVKYVSQYMDAEDSIFILPETMIHLIDHCKKGTAMIWWLSVDNYLGTYSEQIADSGVDVFNLRSRNNTIHFVQSKYAKDFLKHQMGIEESFYLKDYINDEIVDVANMFYDKLGRENYCLYNPRKMHKELVEVIEQCRPDIAWIPLQGFTPQEMAAIMCRSKVYIDFGNHPGKDRIPREAAVCGCCVITNKLGSAAYQEDVDIPDRYKIENMTDIDTTLQVIYDCIDCYEEREQDFAKYRKAISMEKDEFMRDVNNTIGLLSACIHDVSSVAVDKSHIEILESFASFMNDIKSLTHVSEDLARRSNKAELINKLLDVEYLLHVMTESVTTEIVNLIEE